MSPYSSEGSFNAALNRPVASLMHTLSVPANLALKLRMDVDTQREKSGQKGRSNKAMHEVLLSWDMEVAYRCVTEEEREGDRQRQPDSCP